MTAEPIARVVDDIRHNRVRHLLIAYPCQCWIDPKRRQYHDNRRETEQT